MKKFLCNSVLCMLIITLAMAVSCNSEKEYKLQDGTEIVTVSSEGLSFSGGAAFTFDGQYEGFTIEPAPYSEIHSTVNCNTCGIVDINGAKAYKLEASGYSQEGAGMLIKPAKPMLASVFSGMTVTYMTSSNETKNDLRITKGDATSRGETVNEYPDLSGAAEKWRTVNLGLSSMGAIADEDGYIRSFVIFLRNYDNADVYIQNITFKVDIDSVCSVDIDSSESLYEKGAVTSIANEIAYKLTEAGIGAEITVTCEQYKQNSLSQNGEITYYVDLTSGKNTDFTDSISKTIPALREAWLTEGDKVYGYEISTPGKVDSSALNQGLMTITDTKVVCNEKVKGAQYAVYEAGSDYLDKDLSWRDAQYVKVSKKGTKKIFVNAFLDYAEFLSQGTKYNIAIRLVTEDDNYIPVCQKEFTYSMENTAVGEAMLAAKETVMNTKVECGSGNDKEEKVRKALTDAISNPEIDVKVKLISNSVSVSYFDIVIISKKDKNFGYGGQSFMVKDYVSWHDVRNLDNEIIPQTPHDGLEDIVLAQDFIVTHFTNSYSEIRSPKYPFYSPLEICTPPAITFSWTDKNDTGSYTLYIADNIDFENAVEYTTKKTSIDIYNFQPGIKYYWKVVSDSSQSVVFTFSIGKGYTRFLKIDGVKNIRDLGGYKTASGQTVKYGILYRSANMDSITPTGKKELVNRLGVKTDMDFRGDSGPSPLGKDINYIELAIKWYSGIFADAEKLDLIRQTIVEYSKIENYPMCYHCAVGRDRTGTMSFLILGLLGVDEETLVREYYLSMYSAMGSFSESEFNALTDQLFPFISRLHQYGDSDDTISEKIEAFMLDIGVTKEEINSIRSILLEGEPTIDKQEQGCQSGVTAFPIMIILAGFVALKKKATCK